MFKGCSSVEGLDVVLDYLEDSVQEQVLFVTADLVDGQKGQHSHRLLSCAPLLNQLLQREKGGENYLCM